MIIIIIMIMMIIMIMIINIFIMIFFRISWLRTQIHRMILLFLLSLCPIASNFVVKIV